MTTAALPAFMDSTTLLGAFGLLGVLIIVFAETALLLGFFLPGDSLLFTAGLLAAGAAPFAPLWLLLVTIPVAAVLGDQVGYQIGRRAGPSLYKREDSKFFRRSHVEKAQAFFEKYGARTVALARFVPIVRTFTPTVAGASGMRPRTFVIYNLLGGVLWGTGVTLLGYSLGGVPFVRDHIELILVSIVAVSVLPVLAHLIRQRLRQPAR
ncbi:DedA family protein [Nakamurella antarctica]|uniref:DedA family protein n=1 Tax=Nakamurella antarctica TaxID=1902245 RepID=A0A3G8ZWI1_9ACTN|nr:VTT domain-containing protein [Nakamurella antarctica]AZI58794.1 DedA family protein [Nakamurella antarctica]